MKKIIQWFKNLHFLIVNVRKIYSELREYNDKVNFCLSEIRETNKVIKDRTNYHVDMSMVGYDPHIVITIGKYKKNDYIRIHSIYNDKRFEELIDYLREMEKYGDLGRVEQPHKLGIFDEYIVPKAKEYTTETKYKLKNNRNADQ